MSHLSNRPINEDEQSVIDSLEALPISGTNEGIQKTGLFSFSNKEFSSGGGTWGSITGTLSNQTDLQSVLDSKISSASWSSLTGTPTALLLDQTTPQTVSGGVPIFDDGWQSNLWYRNGYGTTMYIKTGRDTAFTALATSTTDAGALTSVRTALSTGTATATTILNTNAYRFWVGNSTPFNTIGMWITTAAVGGTALILEYWNGSYWVAVSNMSDGTNLLTQAGTITYDIPGDWATLDKGDGSGAVYWLKMRTSTSTAPDCQVQLVQPISYTANDLFNFVPNPLDTSTTNGIYINTFGKVAIPRITGAVAFESTVSTGALTVTGAISATTTITATTTMGCAGLTSTIANTDNYYTGASITTTPGASTGITAALIPTRVASPIRILSTAWDVDGAVSENQNWYMTAIPYAGNTPSSRFVITQNKGAFGGQDHELMTISEDGNLTMLGDTLGDEVFTNGAFTSGTSWNVTGSFALTSDTAKFTAAAGALTGTLYQASTDYATALKPYRWYKFTYTTSAINTTVRAYIGSEVLEVERLYLPGVMATAGTYTRYFKTNASPGNFTIYADGAAASDSVTFDNVSLKEVISGNVAACGRFTGGGTAGILINETGVATFDFPPILVMSEGTIPYVGVGGQLTENAGMNWIAADARLGILNPTPAYTLDVGGIIYSSTALISPLWYPVSDSTTALQINKADGTTNILNVDTTNARVGIGTDAPEGKIHLLVSDFTDTPIFERGSQTSDTLWNTIRVLATKTSNMGDGFGVSTVYSIRDDSGVINQIGSIGAVRAGADNTGDIVFYPYSAGSASEKMRITNAGYVGTGQSAPHTILHTKSFATELTQATANVDLNTTHHTLEITANSFTQALPTAVGIQGRIYVIKNSGTGTITLDGNGSETIDGASTITLSQYDSVTVQSNGTNWIII